MTNPSNPTLTIHVASVGTPIPSDATTPLPEQFKPAGVGRIHITQHHRDHTIGLFTQLVPAQPQMRIEWTTREPGWPEVGDGCVVVGQGEDRNGHPWRLVAHEASRIEHGQAGVGPVTTAELTPDETGAAACWHHHDTLSQ